MMAGNAFYLQNAQSASTASVPVLPLESFRCAVIAAVKAGARISSFFGYPTNSHDRTGTSPVPTTTTGPEDNLRLLAVLADDEAGNLRLLATEVGRAYPALTPECPQAHWFEREIAEQWNVVPEGHPWLKPIRFQPPRRPASGAKASAARPMIGVTDFFQVTGEEVHEVAVGPVHAGIIEPGHFRFQCYGETVLHLEISLGYQHRGVERALLGGPTPRSLHYAETLAGDTTVGHALAYCQALEALSLCQVPPRADALRGVALELERAANHIGDLGALAGDVGFLPTMSYCGRIRGDVLNMTAVICGNRFGRGLLRPGGVGFDIDAAHVKELLERLAAVTRDVTVAVNLLWNTASVTGRFEGTGVVSRDLAREIGLVGPAARASGLERDVRQQQPSGIYCFTHLPMAVFESGDVFARAYVRWLEVQRSLAWIGEQLQALPGGEVSEPLDSLADNRLVVSLVEGWRGEICHVALTDDDGRFAAYKVVDPSLHNWFGLACALRNQAISDFPLCNKSFNLSYCGHDL